MQTRCQPYDRLLTIMWLICAVLFVVVLPGKLLAVRQVPASGNVNNSPIIGILSEEIRSPRYPEGTSFISASYVKWVESAGGRSAPILINQSPAYYQEMFSAVNGILFPGGGVSLRTSAYAKAGNILYNLALQANKNGVYFPIWGTCLGFELLSELSANRSFKLSSCNSENISLPLTFQQDLETSHMFRVAPKYIVDALRTQDVTANYHKFCVTPQDFARVGLDKSLRLLSTSVDRDGKIFISAVEGLQFPFYGVQFHPEKNRRISGVIPNSVDASHVLSQFFANGFLSEGTSNLPNSEYPCFLHNSDYLNCVS